MDEILPFNSSLTLTSVRVFLDEEDPLIQKIGIPLSFSVKLEENMRTPLPLSLSLSFAHTHTHAYSQTHTQFHFVLSNPAPVPPM